MTENEKRLQLALERILFWANEALVNLTKLQDVAFSVNRIETWISDAKYWIRRIETERTGKEDSE